MCSGTLCCVNIFEDDAFFRLTLVIAFDELTPLRLNMRFWGIFENYQQKTVLLLSPKKHLLIELRLIYNDCRESPPNLVVRSRQAVIIKISLKTILGSHAGIPKISFLIFPFL